MDFIGKSVLAAMADIYGAAACARCDTPRVVLSFASQEQRYRFECSLKAGLDPFLAMEATLSRPDHEYQLAGVVFELGVSP